VNNIVFFPETNKFETVHGRKKEKIRTNDATIELGD
jgi:predicted secreted protein